MFPPVCEFADSIKISFVSESRAIRERRDTQLGTFAPLSCSPRRTSPHPSCVLAIVSLEEFSDHRRVIIIVVVGEAAAHTFGYFLDVHTYINIFINT